MILKNATEKLLNSSNEAKVFSKKVSSSFGWIAIITISCLFGLAVINDLFRCLKFLNKWNHLNVKNKINSSKQKPNENNDSESVYQKVKNYDHQIREKLKKIKEKEKWRQQNK